MDRPFPWALIVIAVGLGWGTLISGSAWARYFGLAAVTVVACAIAFQIALRDREREQARRQADAEEFSDAWEEPES
ncbi:MAG: hypothetical protein QM597_06310 [Aeromicrobium sp.]|uniref:hypothetical protein n=1 Tax=Aeromicrobium sp. TaxID=1871063 RepID=UPI0039E3CDFD